LKIEECSMNLMTRGLNLGVEKIEDFWETADLLWIVKLFYLIFYESINLVILWGCL